MPITLCRTLTQVHFKILQVDIIHFYYDDCLEIILSGRLLQIYFFESPEYKTYAFSKQLHKFL